MIGKKIIIIKKVFAIIVIISFIGSMIPVNAITSDSQMVKDAYDEYMLTPLSESDSSNPLIKHLMKTVPDIDAASVLKFYQDSLIDQTAWKNVLKDQDRAQFYSDYLSGADTLYNFSGGDKFTARQAYDNVEAIRNQISRLQQYEKTLASLSHDDKLRFIHYEYRSDINLDKCFDGWSIHKINYVLEHASLNLNTFDDQPKSQYDKEGWKHYAFLANESMQNFTRDVGIFAEDWNRQNPDGGPNETEIKTSKVLENIYDMNDTANYINDKHYNCLYTSMRMKTAGIILLGAGTSMMAGSGTNMISEKVGAIKAARAQANLPKPMEVKETPDKIIVSEDRTPNLRWSEYPDVIDESIASERFGHAIGDAKPNAKFNMINPQTKEEVFLSQQMQDQAIVIRGIQDFETINSEQDLGFNDIRELGSHVMRYGKYVTRNGDSTLQYSISSLYSRAMSHGYFENGLIYFLSPNGKVCVIDVHVTCNNNIITVSINSRGWNGPATNPIKFDFTRTTLTGGGRYNVPGVFYVRCNYMQVTVDQAQTIVVPNHVKSVVELDAEGMGQQVRPIGELLASMTENETHIIKKPTGEFLMFDKKGLKDNLENGNLTVKDEYGTVRPANPYDLLNLTGQVTTDAPFDFDIFTGTDYANFQDKNVDKRQNMIVTWASFAGASVGSYFISFGLPRILLKIVDTIPGLNVVFMIIGIILAAIGAVLLVVADILDKVVDSCGNALAAILDKLNAQVKFYKYIYSPVI